MSSTHRSILVVGAHPDDEALGCGGSMARWASEGCAVHTVLLADGEGARSTFGGVPDDILQRRRVAESAGRVIGTASTRFFDFPDNRMDTVALLDVVKAIEGVIRDVEADTVVTHHTGDVNVDHRIVHDAVLAATRPQPGSLVKRVLFFEVPSSSEWRPPCSSQYFAPNLFVDISKTLSMKMRALDEYKAEMRDFPHSRSLAAVEALARWRGASCGVAAAEAFILGRQIE